MIALGPIAFAQPWFLLALFTLPVIWWLLRATPPRPQQIFFPPTRLMKDLQSKEQTPSHSPWWLTALRVLLAACIILALSRPVLNPEKNAALADGPLIIVVDNSWASAKNWQRRQSYLDNLIERANQNAQPLALVATADEGRTSQIALEAPGKAKERAASLTPLPYAPSRLETLRKIEKELKDVRSPSIFWLSDGLDYGHVEEFSKGLLSLTGQTGTLKLITANEASSPLGITASPQASYALKAKIIRADGGPQEGVITAWSARGDQLGKSSFQFADNANQTEASFTLPLELRNQIARLEIAGEQTAGAVHLLDARSQRQRIGLISGEARELSQPLLSPLYYIERALHPFSDLIASNNRNLDAATEELLRQNPSTLILADIGKLVGETLGRVETWVEKGGVLVRFAGPRLERDGDNLLPVALRQGGRTLGGALSWSTPQRLAPFEEKSLFHGLALPDDVSVNRQILADPTKTRANTDVWARLQDGTPLVTAAKRGEGWIVLFHITANSEWSTLPHSGLFVQMLRRLSELSSYTGSFSDVADDSAATTGEKNAVARSFARQETLPPLQTLDGFGRLSSPPPLAEPVNIARIDKTRPSAKHPPGFYGAPASPRVINLIGPRTMLRTAKILPANAVSENYVTKQPLTLRPWLLLAALLIFCVDALAVMLLSGGITRGRLAPRGGKLRPASKLAASFFLTLSILAVSSTHLHAQVGAQDTQLDRESFALKAALKTRLAYVVTGNPSIDETSYKGLDGLSRVIGARTAIEPGAPMGVNINRDELAFFPVLYWPIREDAKPLAEKTLARLDAYMKQGGLVLFDTRDYQKTMQFSATAQGPGAAALQRVLGKLDIPRLEPVPASHVLTKSFYLLDSFPGRWEGGALWVEAGNDTQASGERRARRADGVSSILITSNDFASAWALDDRNRPVFPVVPGGEMQREMAFRSGINIVIYALTGNYKADQVHIPALLERLGQ